MRLIFARHGETELNIAGKTHISGDNVGLDQLGKTQAKKLQLVLRQNTVSKIFFSPELRARETAEIARAELNVPLEEAPELRERDWGQWQGKPWEKIKEILDKMTLEERYSFIPPGGESWKQLEERLKRFLEKITNSNETCVFVVTHGGSLRGLMPILKNQPLQTSLTYDFKNASVTIFDYENGKYNEILVNDTSHLAQ